MTDPRESAHFWRAVDANLAAYRKGLYDVNVECDPRGECSARGRCDAHHDHGLGLGLIAALPHLRQMIAEEVRAEAESIVLPIQRVAWAACSSFIKRGPDA